MPETPTHDPAAPAGEGRPSATSPAPDGGRVTAKRFQRREADPHAVRVTAADFNGSSWDGSPFSTWAEWVGEAMQADALRPVTPGSTDYSEWEVDTAGGCYLASPGDWIALAPVSGHLIVLREVTGPLHKPRKPLEPR